MPTTAERAVLRIILTTSCSESSGSTLASADADQHNKGSLGPVDERTRSRALEQPSLHRLHGGLHPVLDLELGEDVRDVVLHGLDADEELLRDLGVLLALRQQAQDFRLAFRELGSGLFRHWWSARAVPHTLEDVRRDPG